LQIREQPIQLFKAPGECAPFSCPSGDCALQFSRATLLLPCGLQSWQDEPQFTMTFGVAFNRVGLGKEFVPTLPLFPYVRESSLQIDPPFRLQHELGETFDLRLRMLECSTGRFDVLVRKVQCSIRDLLLSVELMLESLQASLGTAAPFVHAAVQPLIALKVNEAGQHLEAILGRGGQQLISLPLQQKHRRSKSFVGEPNMAAHPCIEASLVGGIRHGLPASMPVAVAARAMGSIADLLRACNTAVLVDFEGAPGLIKLTLKQEVEFHAQRVGCFIDECLRSLNATAMAAKESVGNGIKHGRFAAAVGAREQPKRSTIEANFLLVAVTKETAHGDALRNHSDSSASNSSARLSRARRSEWSANSACK